MNILIVEDNKYQLDNLKKMVIEELGSDIGNVYCATDVQTAKQIYLEDDIHLFMLDVSLGYDSGLKLANDIRNNAKYDDAFIAIISAHKKFEDRSFLESKCHVFIEKPYKKEAILELVNHALINYLEKV